MPAPSKTLPTNFGENELSDTNIEAQRMAAWTHAHAIALRAGEQNRYLTGPEQRDYEAHVTDFERLDSEIRAGGRNGARSPEDWIAALDTNRSAPTLTPPPMDVLRHRSEIQERIHHANLEIDRLQLLVEQLRAADASAAAIEQHDRANNWDDTLDHRKWVAKNMPEPSENN